MRKPKGNYFAVGLNYEYTILYAAFDAPQPDQSEWGSFEVCRTLTAAKNQIRYWVSTDRVDLQTELANALAIKESDLK